MQHIQILPNLQVFAKVQKTVAKNVIVNDFNQEVYLAQNTSFERCATLKEKYGIKEQQPMLNEADILLHFFRFYSSEFDTNKHAIDIS